ncbi:DUF1987 domain-containing protein [Pseudothauera nasutitermitis]|uniref:DUF1987 domain-containing protein n=1 Tax=Pseudothauera nasutitermitis TaxID=2565930 RepID=A0A4V3WCE9_9RHOO|nr:DUF1987 domain-containing protein [Pseudothauera nasutitermitis]THF66894.1 DUF1987 domain-containing protein [Pseudothauera nasutitermitis]
MQNLLIAASPNTPEIDFRFDQHLLSLQGESYPENAAAFYGPVLEALRGYLARTEDRPLTVNVSLSYFNSSSTKMLFTLFGVLDQAARDGRRITLNWFHEEEDDTIFEFGQELEEDFQALDFHDHPVRHRP